MVSPNSPEFPGNISPDTRTNLPTLKSFGCRSSDGNEFTLTGTKCPDYAIAVNTQALPVAQAKSDRLLYLSCKGSAHSQTFEGEKRYKNYRATYWFDLSKKSVKEINGQYRNNVKIKRFDADGVEFDVGNWEVVEIDRRTGDWVHQYKFATASGTCEKEDPPEQKF